MKHFCYNSVFNGEILYKSVNYLTNTRFVYLKAIFIKVLSPFSITSLR